MWAVHRRAQIGLALIKGKDPRPQHGTFVVTLPRTAGFSAYHEMAGSVGWDQTLTHFFLPVAQLLPHYLRTHRRRSGFSQEEVARLLGAVSGTKVSRYENFSRRPSVAAIFAFEIVFNRPARELFAGSYEEVRLDVQERAKRLAEAIAKHAGDPRTARKLALLRGIVESKPYAVRHD